MDPTLYDAFAVAETILPVENSSTLRVFRAARSAFESYNEVALSSLSETASAAAGVSEARDNVRAALQNIRNAGDHVAAVSSLGNNVQNFIVIMCGLGFNLQPSRAQSFPMQAEQAFRPAPGPSAPPRARNRVLSIPILEQINAMGLSVEHHSGADSEALIDRSGSGDVHYGKPTARQDSQIIDGDIVTPEAAAVITASGRPFRIINTGNTYYGEAEASDRARILRGTYFGNGFFRSDSAPAVPEMNQRYESVSDEEEEDFR